MTDYSQAYCINVPTECFFDSTLYREVAIAFCVQCPIREQCLRDCLEAEETPVDGKKWRCGVFGGLSPNGRNRYAGTSYDVLSDDWMEKNENNYRN